MVGSDAAAGEEILVTRFGKPCVRIVPAKQPRTFLGAGKHLGQKKPVSPEPIPEPAVEERLQLPAADDAEAELRRPPRRLEDRFQAVQRD